jgi:hypothetical protein
MKKLTFSDGDVFHVLLDNAKSRPDPLGNRGQKVGLGKPCPANDIGWSFASSSLGVSDVVSDCGIVAQTGWTFFKSWNFTKKFWLKFFSNVSYTMGVFGSNLKFNSWLKNSIKMWKIRNVKNNHQDFYLLLVP